jgi:hypothetical protein
MQAQSPAFGGTDHLLTSFLAVNETEDFMRCWKQWSCDKCLEQHGCGWCPYVILCPPQSLFYLWSRPLSSSLLLPPELVPCSLDPRNRKIKKKEKKRKKKRKKGLSLTRLFSFRQTSACIPTDSSVPILAPIHGNICPDEHERWELRTRPLGCNVSTRNFLSVVAAEAITAVLLLLLWLLYVCARGCLRYKRRHPEWRRNVRDKVSAFWPGRTSRETAPLLAGGYPSDSSDSV